MDRVDPTDDIPVGFEHIVYRGCDATATELQRWPGVTAKGREMIFGKLKSVGHTEMLAVPAEWASQARLQP